MGRPIKKTRKHQKKSLVKGGKKKRGGSKKVIQKKKRVSRKGRMLGGDDLALHRACRDGNIEVALDLIEKGAAIDARNRKQRTPLHFACQEGHLNVALALIEKGADIHARSSGQRTPLHLAIRNGHLEIVKALITAGAKVNIKADYKTSLDFAFQSENLEIVNALIEHGADVNEGDILGNTYLHHGVFEGLTEKVKLIIKAGADINARNDSRYTPLHYACMYGGLEITKELIKAGADINARNIENETPNCSPEMIKLFNRLWRSTPLLTAMHSNNMDAFKTLLNDYTYDVNEDVSTNGDGWTILHAAASLNLNVNRMKYVDLLLEDGRVDVDATTNDGKTALMIANERGDVELVKRLGENM